MTAKRHLLIGAVGLVKGNVRNDGRAMVSVCDELEPVFDAHGALRGAPFHVVSLIVRYGTKRSEPEIGKLNRRYSELEAAFELPMAEMQKLDFAGLRMELKKAALSTLVAVAEKYGLPREPWERLLALRSDPDSGH